MRRVTLGRKTVTRPLRLMLVLVLGVAIALLAAGSPLSAQPQRLPTAPSLALDQDWHYHWDEQFQSSDLPPAVQQWPTVNVPHRLPVKVGHPVLWLTLPLPMGNWQTPTLYIQGIPNILEAYIADEVVYTLNQLDRQGQPLQNEGAFPLVALQPEQLGQTLKLRLYIGHIGQDNRVIPLGYGGVPKIGEQDDLFRALIVQDSLRLILGFLFFSCGLFPLILALWRTTDTSYISFGCVALLIGIYTITPAQIIRLLFDYSIVWTYVHHLAFHLLPVSICLFFEHLFGAGPKQIVRRLWQVHAVYGPLAILLAGSQISTWAEAAFPTQILGLLSASVLIILSWVNAARGNPEAKIFAWGFSLFLGFAVYDLIVYLAPQTLWRFQLYVWGMLIFLICLAFILERQFTQAQNHLKAYNKASDRFVPHEFLRLLNKQSIIDVSLGDQVNQEMTVLFSDIRAFTSLSETMTPERNFNFLNAYLECVSPVIREHNGFIDKYIGDAIMALFPYGAEDAIQAAIAMQRQLAAFNQRIIHQGYPSISIGIGLHQGNVMLGTIGESQRMETTVIADAVNLASRLEDSTKQYGATLVVSQETLERLSDSEQFEHRFLGKILVKGKKEPIRICEVYSADPEELRAFKTQTRDRFEAAICQYDQGDRAGAQVVFEQLWHENPEDKVVRLCLLRCKAL